MVPGEEPVRLIGDAGWSSLEGPIKQFVQAWREGRRPAIEDYLPTGGPWRSPLLVELVHTELELRIKAGEAARAEEYLARYPALRDDRAAAVSLIAAEHDLRRRAEPALDLDEYLRRFPQYGGDLSERIARPTVLDHGGESPPARRMGQHDQTPVEVPGYEVRRELGRGGMGVVFEALQLSLNRRVALKFLPIECAQDPVWLARFRHEARTASNLNHPNVCTIYDTGQSGSRPYLSMEFIEGQTLEVLGRRHPSLKEVVRWVAQAACALTAAHAAGVVHRDVKPANVMVRDDGLVKVLDFGLARRLSADPAPAAGGPKTDPGTFVGTPAYVSPEQARVEPVGTASDVFSLGLVLYELATGRHPFAGGPLPILHALQSQAPVPPSRLNPEIPAALSDLILKMLHKSAPARPTAAAVEVELLRLATADAGAAARTRAAPVKRPTVPRREELDALRRHFEEAADGRGSFLCLTGEAGIGKTTLVECLLDELTAAGRPFTLARGRCSERLAGAEAYLPFLEALDSLLQGEAGPSSAALMKQVAPAWYVQLAPLASAELAAGGASQERLKREFAAFLAEASRDRPLILFLDDLHWADPSSVDLLAYLGGKCASTRLLVLLAYRPVDLIQGRHPFLAVQLEMQGRGVCREFGLRHFSRADLDDYLALAFVGHHFPDEFVAAIHARTGGNPLYVVDLLRYLRDRQVLVQQGDRWEVAQPTPDLHSELPESVRSMIRRTIDNLQEADRRLLMAASVQGSEFDAAVVARIQNQEAADVEERLDVLERVHGLVRLLGEREFPDGTLTLRYGFVHVLYQNALYASLQPARRVSWSATAAATLRACYGEKSSAVAGELALLYEVARDAEQAVAHFQIAARNAVRVSAHREAAALARRGLSLLEKLPESPQRVGQELALLQALGVSLVATQGFASPDVERTYLRARDLCERAGDQAGLFPVLYGLWNVSLLRCDLPRCTQLATQAFALAEGLADPIFLLQAYNVLQQPLLHQGDLEAARRGQERGLALYYAHCHGGLTATFGEDPGVGCLTYGAVTLWLLGYPDQALRSWQAARRLAEDLANPFDLGRALYFGAFTHLCRGEVAVVEELAGLLRELADEQGFAFLSAGATIFLGWTLAEQGQTPAGVAQMRQGLASWQATGALSHRPYQLALLARALAEGGPDGEGLRCADEALALAASTGERFLEAELHRLRGEILLAGAAGPARAAAAEACFGRSLEVARRQGARSLELRALLSLAGLLRRQGRAAEARPLLAETYAWFTEGFETPDLRQARELLGEGSPEGSRQ
jgi:predicted ATPase